MANYKSMFDKEKCEYKLGKIGAELLETFHSLPKIAQDIYLKYFLSFRGDKSDESENFGELEFFMENVVAGISIANSCNSPIEQIFACALDFMYMIKYYGSLSANYSIKPQYEIMTNKQKRIIDFAIYVNFNPDDVILLIECDGYDYHAKTKEQFENTNKKDREVRLLGYDILHFTGTEIYKNPLKCANETWEYIVKKEEQNGNI